MIELIPETQATPLDPAQLFGRVAPLHADLGCGDGSFLRALATEYPETNFLGIERLLRRVRSSDRKAATLPNVRIIRSETSFFLRHLLPPESVDVFYLLFPDPGPKRRHHRRRIISSDFLDAIAACLKSASPARTGGSLFVATDHDDYFAAIRNLLGESSDFVPVEGIWPLPASTFEQRFRSAGIPIHRLELRKASPLA